MASLLHLQVSPKSTDAFSRRLGDNFVSALRESNPAVNVITRDLGQDPLPPLDHDFALASLAHVSGAVPASPLALSEALITELEQADRLVISTPMHNFTVPAALKLWIDYVVRPHRTFGFGPAGKAGLLADRPVDVLVTCGGGFTDGSGSQMDFFSPYLRYVLGTIGLKSISILRLENAIRQRDAAEERARSWMKERVG